MGEVEPDRQACKGRGSRERSRYKWGGGVVFEEDLGAQTGAELVVSGKVDVEFALSGRHLAVVLVDAA